MPIYQSTPDQRTWSADNAVDLINAMRAQPVAIANDVIAFMAQWPPRPPGTPIRTDTPDNWLEDLLKLGFVKVVNPPGSDSPRTNGRNAARPSAASTGS